MKPDFHGVRCETENRTSLFNAVLADIAKDYRRPQWDGQANEMRDESADGQVVEQSAVPCKPKVQRLLIPL